MSLVFDEGQFLLDLQDALQTALAGVLDATQIRVVDGTPEDGTLFSDLIPPALIIALTGYSPIYGLGKKRRVENLAIQFLPLAVVWDSSDEWGTMLDPAVGSLELRRLVALAVETLGSLEDGAFTLTDSDWSINFWMPGDRAAPVRIVLGEGEEDISTTALVYLYDLEGPVG